jgi:hypothetical protein
MQHPILQLLCSTEASYPIFTLATVPDSRCCRPWRLAGDVGADGSPVKECPESLHPQPPVVRPASGRRPPDGAHQWKGSGPRHTPVVGDLERPRQPYPLQTETLSREYSRRPGRPSFETSTRRSWRPRSRATSTTRVEGTRLPTLARDRCSGGAGSRSRAPPGRTPAARGASGRRGRARCSPFLMLPNSRMCGIVNSRSAGIWTARRPGVMGRHGLRRLLNPPRRSLDRVSPGGR